MNENKKKIIILGLFDSVHIGHRYLIDAGKDLAETVNGEVIVYTFDDGFYSELGIPRKDVYLLKERISIIESLGVKTKVLPTNRDFFDKSEWDFIDFLVEDNPYCVVAGLDYHFGKNATGDAFKLKSELSKRGIHSAICDIIKYKGTKISTSDISKYLIDGNIRLANILLGSPFFIMGTVVNGLHNGKLLGFPTANFDFDNNKLIPKCGVYATKTYIGDLCYPSVTNVGTHPTFNYNSINCETYIIGLEDDIYGKEIKIEFYEFIREIQSFSSKEELISQLNNDVTKAKEVLKI